MKKVILFCIILGMANVSFAGVETFDTDEAGWIFAFTNSYVGDFWQTNHHSTGGNPDGHITGSDFYNTPLFNVRKTDSFGDITGLDITVDNKTTSYVGTAQFFVGSGTSYYTVNGSWAVENDTEWTTHAATMSAGNLTALSVPKIGGLSSAQVLAAAETLGLVFSTPSSKGGSTPGMAGDFNTYFVDNIGVVPEPATMALLGLGGLLIRRKK